MRSHSTILEALAYHAAATPDKRLFTWVDEKCREQRRMTYKELEDESNAVAARLLKLGCKKGDRVMIAYPMGLEFLAGMLGAMKISVIPCSIYPPNPTQLKTAMPKFRGFVKDAGAKYALSTNTFANAMTAASVLYKSGVKWIGTDKLPIKKSNLSKPKDYERFVGAPEEICFIQYTSGSTGRPKGVMISHRNLVENCEIIRSVSADREDEIDTSTGVLWLPQYHDMGLVGGFMVSIYAGNRTVAASPLDFIVNPLLWSDMIETYKATHTNAPNFAYALLLKRLQQANRKADWSTIKRAGFGGEPAQGHVLDALAKTLSIKRENVYNFYGLAEAVVYVTGGPGYPDPEGLVCCGVVDSPTLKLRIVLDGKEVEDGQVGSIWAQSPRVAAGYYGQPELTNATFANVLPGYDGNWLDTGDLGKIVDGQLYVTGRVKDVIIFNGKNYYPTDVEVSIEAAFGDVIRPGRTAAFQHGEASIGITAEARKGFDKAANADLAIKLANHVSQANGLFVTEVVILKLGFNPKTTSGKLKRSEIRKTTTAGEWKESSVLLRFQRKEQTTVCPKEQGSSFLERSCSLQGVPSRDLAGDAFAEMTANGAKQLAGQACPGSRYGTGCPCDESGDMFSFYKGEKSMTYLHGGITETATIDYSAVIAELGELESQMKTGSIERGNDISTWMFQDTRLWTSVPGIKSHQFGLGCPYSVHKQGRLMLEAAFAKLPSLEAMRLSFHTVIDGIGKSGELSADHIRSWVTRTLFKSLVGKDLTLTEELDFHLFQARFLDITMCPYKRPEDERLLQIKSSFVKDFTQNHGIDEDFAPFLLDAIVFGNQLPSLINCCLALACGDNKFYDASSEEEIDESNAHQFVWECCRLFPTVAAVPWRKDNQRHIAVIGMAGRDKSVWGEDVECFRPTRCSREQFEKKSCFFAEQANSYKCPSTRFSMDAAAAVLLEVTQHSWSRPKMQSSWKLPYFNDIVLRRDATTKHVAVIGGGAAGLMCALKLAQSNIKVTILERNDVIGGHARHTEVFGHQRNPAFGMFIKDESPNLMALTRELGIEPISLGETKKFRHILHQGDHKIPETSSDDVVRFLAEMKRIQSVGACQDETIGQYFERKGYDQDFIVYFFLGRLVTFFPGQKIQDYLNYPLEIVAWFATALWDRSGDLFRLNNRKYMESFESLLKSFNVEVVTSATPRVVSRDDSGVVVSTGRDGDCPLRADKLVLAVPPNAAASILGDLMSHSEGILSDFQCPLETVVLHKDSKWANPRMTNGIFANMPPEYASSLPSLNDTVPFTTSTLSDTDNCTPIYATLAYATHEKLNFDSPTETMSFTHTKLTLDASRQRKLLLREQGKNNTYFAGGWTKGLMIHEDALVSGMEAANSILKESGFSQHLVLERATKLPGAEERKVALGTSGDFSTRYARVITSTFGEEVDFSKTWAENGLTSMKGAELKNHVEEELRAILPSNFVQLYPTPKALQNFLASSEGQSFPKHPAIDQRDFQWKNPRSQCTKLQLGVSQLLGSIVIVLLVLLSVVPSYFLVSKALNQCDSTQGESCHGLLFWMVMPLAVPLFLLSFSAVVLVCKLAVVGQYLPREIELLSWAYFRWWFVDRLLGIWESLVGPFLLETKHMWLFYWLLGVDLAWSAKIESYIREFDLVSVGENTVVAHPINCRKFSQQKEGCPILTFRPILVGKDSHVSSMVSPGATIGSGSKVEKLAVIEEGAEVPDGVVARGNPAHNAGSFENPKSSWSNETIVDAFKMIWHFIEAYFFFAISYLAHAMLNHTLPSWRYATMLHWFLLLPAASCLALMSSIALKWILIGKGKTVEDYEGSLWRQATNWACDFHFRTASFTLTPFIGQSRLWHIILYLHGLDVDLQSGINNPYLIFLPSKVDYVKIRKSFVATISLDLNNKAESQIEIISSSVGYNANIHGGAKIVRSSVLPRSIVADSVYDLNSDGKLWNPSTSDLLLPELAQLLLNVVLFATLIPAYEIGLASIQSSSISLAACGLVAALILQLFVWILSTWAVEGIMLTLPNRTRHSLFGIYLNHVWVFRVGNWAECLLWGTPMFGTYARVMGAEVVGDLWYFGHAIYEFRRMHFTGNTVVDSASLNGHYIDGNGLIISDTRVSGVVHPGCFAIAGSTLSGVENGPWKVFMASDKDNTANSRTSGSSFGAKDLQMAEFVV